MEFLAFLFIMVVAAIGLLRVRFRSVALEEDRRFVEQYISKFQKFSESYSDEFDPELYYWLTHRVLRMQSMASDSVIWGYYSPEYQEDALAKSSALVEILDQMGQHPVTRDKTTTLTSFCVRYLGALDDFIERFRARQKNPILWFREGIEFLVLSPVLALKWATGEEKDAQVEDIIRSPRFRRWASSLSLTAIIVPVVIIFVGWNTLMLLGTQSYLFVGQIVQELVRLFQDLAGGAGLSA